VKNAVKAEAHLVEADDEPELRVRTERSLVQGCHQIIASTQQERKAITKYYCAAPEKISVIPCGVNLEQFRTLDKVQARRHLGIDYDRIVLCVGRIDPLKGVDKLIKALPYIRDVGFRLIVIGGGENSRHEVEQLRRLARTLDVDDSVVFAGPVKHDQLIYYYNAADVCVVPSYYESFGLVALESLACGTPVVATDVGNHRSVIRQGETGYVVKDNAPRRLAEKIALLLAEQGSNTRSASSVRASVSGFSWSNTAEAFIRECRPILGNHSMQLP
jgi:D-inositol-3-phosphate glycosyltransferase